MPADTYSPLIRVTTMADGNDTNTWGDITNVNWNLIEQSIHGMTTIALTNANVTLTVASPSTGDQSHVGVVNLTGNLSGPIVITLPELTHQYLIYNQCTMNGQTITIQTAAAAGNVVLKLAQTIQVFCDGTNVVGVAPGNATGLPSLAGPNSFTGQNSDLFQTLAYSTAITIPTATGTEFYVTLTGSTTFTLSTAAPVDGSVFDLYIKQGGVGNFTAAWAAFAGETILWQGGVTPSLSTQAGAVDRVYMRWSATANAWFAQIFPYFSSSGLPVTTGTINYSMVNLDLWRYLGSPSLAGIFNVSIAAGVVISSASALLPALDVSLFPSGSVVNLTFNGGYVIGAGGNGGQGGAIAAAGGQSWGGTAALGGQNGGDAIKQTTGITLNLLGTGFVYGGGGGGGGSGASATAGGGVAIIANSGGGGGGAGGSLPGIGGLICSASQYDTGAGFTTANLGGTGGYGTGGPLGAAGTGGAAGTPVGSGTGYCSAGGAGGAYGAAGTAGTYTATGTTAFSPLAGAGGLAGNSIRKNGGTNSVGGSITLLGTNS
jgi:hypothetical protein